MQSWIFSNHYWSSVSHDPSEIILYADSALNKLVLNNINVKNTFVLYSSRFLKMESKFFFKTSIFVTLYMSLLSLLINVMHPCWIKNNNNKSQLTKQLNGSELGYYLVYFHCSGIWVWIGFLQIKSPTKWKTLYKPQTLFLPFKSKIYYINDLLEMFNLYFESYLFKLCYSFI